MSALLTILAMLAYLAGAFHVYDMGSEEEIDVFEDVTYLKLAFFFGFMIILFFTLLIGKVMGWDEEGE